MEAIRETGNNLLAALDKHDSVGVLDQYFPHAHFFTEFERFDRHCERLKREGETIDYLTVCSPNYLHDAHIRFGLRLGADVICEKPLVLHPRNIEGLISIEAETGKKVFTLLQLRHHPSVLALREKLAKEKNARRRVELHYVTPRGRWYEYSWKGNADKSGGIVTNIGYHFFDLLTWLFGAVASQEVEYVSDRRAAGNIILENADVHWRLSIEAEDLPPGQSQPYRSLVVDEEEISLDNNFSSLHNTAYANILQGNGVRPVDLLEVTRLVHEIRQQPLHETNPAW